MPELIMIDEPECKLDSETATTISMVSLFAGLGGLISEIVDSCVDKLIASFQNAWARIREIFERFMDDYISATHREKEEVKRRRLHALFMAALLFVIAKPIALMFVICCVIVRSIQLHKHQDRGSEPLSDDSFNNVPLLTIA